MSLFNWCNPLIQQGSMFCILDFQTSKSEKYFFFWFFFVGIYGMLINSKKSTFLKQAWPNFKLRLIANASSV